MSRKSRSSSSTEEHLDRLCDEFRDEFGHLPMRMDDVAMWAIRTKKWQPEDRKIMKELSRKLSRAARNRQHRDPNGRIVRTMHAAKYPKTDQNGNLVFETMWDHILDMSAEHARVSFTQRWHQIAGKCRQLSRDVASFQEFNPNGSAVQLTLPLDFSGEIEDRDEQRVEEITPSDPAPRKVPPKG